MCNISGGTALVYMCVRMYMYCMCGISLLFSMVMLVKDHVLVFTCYLINSTAPWTYHNDCMIKATLVFY